MGTVHAYAQEVFDAIDECQNEARKAGINPQCAVERARKLFQATDMSLAQGMRKMARDINAGTAGPCPYDTNGDGDCHLCTRPNS